MMAVRPVVCGHAQADGGHVEFLIITTTPDGRQVTSRQRFSAFLALHRDLRFLINVGRLQLGLPEVFPVAKSVLLRSTKSRVQRAAELNAYLQTVASLAGDSPPKALLSFLNLDTSSIGEVKQAVPVSLAFVTRAMTAGSESPEAAIGASQPTAEDMASAKPHPLPPRGTEELELTRDVYATAFVLASNATVDMYSLSPRTNPQMLLLWGYVLFIVASQTFALASLVFFFPPVVDSETLFVDCLRPSAAAIKWLEVLAGRGLAAAAMSTGTFAAATLAHQCLASEGSDCTPPSFSSDTPTLSSAALEVCIGLDVAFSLPLPSATEGSSTAGAVEFRRLERETFFYENVFGVLARRQPGQGLPIVLTLLQLVCCVWVVVHVYFVDFAAVERLLRFRDFNTWFKPLKGEKPDSKWWVITIPLIQFLLGSSIVAVSCCITCACTSGFDAVMNSLAFTFISTVAEVFNQPLLSYYARLPIANLDPELYGTEQIYYLVASYDAKNSYGIERWAHSWYVRQEDAVAGLLSDFEIRHCPDDYPQHSRKLIEVLRVLFFCVPIVALAACGVIFGAD